MKVIIVRNENGRPQIEALNVRDPWKRNLEQTSVVEKAQDYIYSHLTDRILLPDVAAAVNVSEWHLSKLLNQETGKGFSQILLEARVGLAKEYLLQSKKISMSDIAAAAGFHDAAHFSRDFKKVTGLTPTEWKNIGWSNEAYKRKIPQKL